MKTRQEVFIAFRDEAGQLKAIADQNGSTHFYWTRKMNKDDVAELLGAEPMAQ